MATIFNPDEEENKNAPGVTTPIQTTNVPGGAAGTAAGAAPAARPEGSGRFTNIQKYLSANSQGGQQVAQGIGSNIQKGIDKSKDAANDNLSQIRQNVEGAQNVAQQGGQYLQDLKGINQNIQQATSPDAALNRPDDLGIQSFVDQPNFNQFQDIQAGRGINEDLLSSQQSDLLQNSQQYLQGAQSASDQISSEGGRFDLLRQTFGGDVNPQYSAGQQRLDQLFLARQGLDPLQQSLQSDINQARDLSGQVSDVSSDADRVIAQENQLVGDLNQQSFDNEQAYVDMLSSYVPTINELRDSQYNEAADRFGAAGATSGASLSDADLDALGVSRGQSLYDVFDGLNFEDVSTRNANANTFQDIASDTDVNRYNAIAQMAGISDDQRALTQAGGLSDAFSFDEGESSFGNRLSNRQDSLNQQDKSAVDNFMATGGQGTLWRDTGVDGVDNARDFMDRARESLVGQSYIRDINAQRERGDTILGGQGNIDFARLMDQAALMDRLEGTTLQSTDDKRDTPVFDENGNLISNNSNVIKKGV